MLILQKPQHVLRWYGLAVGLAAWAGTVWLLDHVLASDGAGILLGGVLFFLVWAGITIVHAPFAVRLGVDPDRGVILLGSTEHPLEDVLGVHARTWPVRGGAGTVEVEHELHLAASANPVLLRLSSARPHMDRPRLEAYEALLARLDLGPRNPVVRREQQRDPDAEEEHPLHRELERAAALGQLRRLLEDPEFAGGAAPMGSDEADAEGDLDRIQPHYRDDFPEFFEEGPWDAKAAGRGGEGLLADHRAVVRDLGEQIGRRTTGLRKARRLLAAMLGVTLVLLLLAALLTRFEAMPDAVENAADLLLILTIPLALVAAVLHSFVHDLHVRAVRREGDRLLRPPSPASHSVAALAQHWWGTIKADRDPDGSGPDAAVEARSPAEYPEGMVMESGAVPEALARAWFDNPRKSLVVLAWVLVAGACALVITGVVTGAWLWYAGGGVLGLAAAGTFLASGRNDTHRRRDLADFAQRLDALRRSGGARSS